jgi:hypothetical protein
MNFLNSIAVAALVTTASTTLAGPVINLAPSQLADGLSGIDNSEFIEIRGTAISDKYIDFSIYSDTEGDAPELLYEGTLMTRVVRSHMTGNLHFNYRVFDGNTDMNGRISHIEVGGFGEYQTRVEYRSDTIPDADEGPSSAHRSLDGNILDFAFDGGLNTEDDTMYFFAMVNTDTFYEDATLATIYLETGHSVSLVVDSATPGVPAPGALALLGSAGLIAGRRRR